MRADLVTLLVVLPQRSTRHRGRRERKQQRQAALMFLIACVVVFVSMFFFGPRDLAPRQYRALGITSSVLVGFLAYFTCGSTKFISDTEMSSYAKIGICLLAAVLASLGFLGLWEIGLSPIRGSQN